MLELLDDLTRVPQVCVREIVVVTYKDGRTENAWSYFLKDEIFNNIKGEQI